MWKRKTRTASCGSKPRPGVLSALLPARRCRPGQVFPPDVGGDGVWHPVRASADLSIFPTHRRLASPRGEEPSSSSPALCAGLALSLRAEYFQSRAAPPVFCGHDKHNPKAKVVFILPQTETRLATGVRRELGTQRALLYITGCRLRKTR